MSADPIEPTTDHEPDRASSGTSEGTVVAGTPVVVRRNAGVAAAIGAAASAIAIAYLYRGVYSGALLDWVLCLAMAGIAAYYLAGLIDARTPLVVADDLGVRIRLGREWRGLPWEAVSQVQVHARRGLLRDGRLVVSSRSVGRVLEGLDARGRRQAALNRKMYGAALAVPVGLTTRITSGGGSLVDAVAALALDRADVVLVEPTPKRAKPSEQAKPSEVERAANPVAKRPKTTRAAADEVREPAEEVREPAEEPIGAVEPAEQPAEEPTRAARTGRVGGFATIVSRVAKSRSAAGPSTTPAPDPVAPEPVVPAPAAASAVPLRSARPALRAQITREGPPTLGAALRADPLYADPLHSGDGQGATLPEGRELRRTGSVDLVFEAVPAPADPRVRPISTLGEPVEPLVIDDFATEPAYDPVIGPELTAARVRVGLSVDDLAERTRIRPHVIESIEVDDFAPCGGDVYARGHLRTLARVLGKDPAPMLATFEKRYASAPVNARRVFEAELATGMTGSVRGSMGGPNWGLLVGAVIVLVLAWGVVRLVATPPSEVQPPTPTLNGSAGLDQDRSADNRADKPTTPVPPITVTLTATQADSGIVVRDASGKVVFAGELVVGAPKTLRATPPVQVNADNAGAVEVAVGGQARGTLGTLGEPGRRTLTRAG